MIGLLLAALLAGQDSVDYWPGRSISGRHDSLIPWGLARDRSRLLAEAERAGGGRQTEAALLVALQYLARHQGLDGGWLASDDRLDTQLTALVILAFLAVDFTPWPDSKFTVPPRYGCRLGTAPDTSGLRDTLSKSDPALFHLSVRRGLRWLLSRQGVDGFIGARGSYGSLSGHALATAVLCEVYGRFPSLVLKGPTEQAVAALLAARAADGRWHGAGAEEEAEVNVWVTLALRSAVLSEFPIPDPAWEGLAFWLGEAKDDFPAASLIGCILHRHRRVKGRSTWNEKAFEWMKQDATSPVVPMSGSLRTFWSVVAHYTLSGPDGFPWKRWRERALPAILAAQDSSIWDRRGSWSPSTVERDAGGTVYSTALHALALSVWHWLRSGPWGG